MFDAQRLLGNLVGGALGGARGAAVFRGGGFGSNASPGLGLLGVAMAAYEPFDARLGR